MNLEINSILPRLGTDVSTSERYGGPARLMRPPSFVTSLSFWCRLGWPEARTQRSYLRHQDSDAPCIAPLWRTRRSFPRGRLSRRPF